MHDSIIVSELCKSYRSVRALDRVSLTVREGELFGLLGVNGAGKTTLIKLLSGLSRATSGDAVVEGLSVSRETEQVKARIAVSPQETAVAPNLTVTENLHFFAGIYGKRDETQLAHIPHTFRLETVADRRAKTLSGGCGGSTPHPCDPTNSSWAMRSPHSPSASRRRSFVSEQGFCCPSCAEPPRSRSARAAC